MKFMLEVVKVFLLNKGLLDLYLHKHKSVLCYRNMKICSGEPAKVSVLYLVLAFRHVGLGMCAHHLSGTLLLEGEMIREVFSLLSFVILLNKTFLPNRSFLLPSPFPGLSQGPILVTVFHFLNFKVVISRPLQLLSLVSEIFETFL